jgi:hypothetical protein
MSKSSNVKKFDNCAKRFTDECPHVNDSAMKRIWDIKNCFLIKGKLIDIIPNTDYERAGNICEKCDAFSPESIGRNSHK